MSGGMPYMMEKGAGLRLIEQYMNAPRPQMLAMLDVLRASDDEDDVRWITKGLPALWDDPLFRRGPQGSGTAVLEHILRQWFGYVPDPGADPNDPDDDGWKRANTVDTGFWVAYSGHVHAIVRSALQWAFELALGIPHDGQGHGRRHPWQIELFWKCMAPWFETWVVHRPVARAGLVSVFFVTPTHKGANIAESPVATEARSLVQGLAHPRPSTQDDYEELGVPHPSDPHHRPRVPAIQRSYGSWVVTHRQHQNAEKVAVSSNNARDTGFGVDAPDLADWGIPLVSRYKGTGDIVIVAPSMAAGGVKHDGGV